MFKKSKKDKENEESKEEMKVYEKIDNFDVVFKKLCDELGICDLSRRPILYERLNAIAKNHDISGIADFEREFDKGEKFKEEVIDAVTVNETYFFREMDNLNWLVEHIQDSDSNLKIMSMPSSDGSEVYSILIMLALKDEKLLNKVQFLGIDINSEVVQKAKDGIYNERGLHKLSEGIKERFFDKVDGLYCIKDFLKDMVEFKRDNIFELSSSKYGYFDVVLSRNLFIYFDSEHRKRASEALHKVVKPDGYLMMGVTDRLEDSVGFKKVHSFIYKKI